MALTSMNTTETGDLSNFKLVTGTVSASTVQAHSGSYSLRCNPTGTGVGYAQADTIDLSVPNGGNVTLSFAFMAASLPTATEMFWAHNTMSLRLMSTGAIEVWSNSAKISTTGVMVTAGAWNWVTIKVSNTVTDTDYNDGYLTFAVTFNGTEITTTAQNSYMNGSSGTPAFGKRTNVSGASVDFYYDDLLFSDGASYPLAESKVVMRKFTSTTPTYDSFAKTGGTTTYSVWSDTPFGTASYASTGTASAAQTAVVATFAPTIASGDTILGSQIALAGKTTSSLAATGYFRRRIGGANTDTITNLSASNSVNYGDIFVPTLTQLNSGMEIGWVKGTGTSTHTIYDAWLITAYTPAAAPPPPAQTTNALFFRLF